MLSGLQPYHEWQFFDVVFDAAYDDEPRCWHDEQHCATKPEPYSAYSGHFPDLNFQVVIWNAHWLLYVDPEQRIDGEKILEYLMRHELGHDYFLGDVTECGWLMDNCDPPTEAHVRPEELTTAHEEYVLRPQAPIDVWETDATSDSITLSWTGAENYVYFFAYLTTTPYSNWEQYGYQWAGSSLTFSRLDPNTRYYFRIVSAASSSLKSSSWPVQANTLSDQDYDGVPDSSDNCPTV